MPLHLLPTSPSYKILLSPSTHFSYLYDSPLIIVQGACPYIYYPLLPAIRFASHHRTGSMPLHLLPTSPSYKILLSPSTHFSYLYDSPLIIVQGACPYIYYPLLPAIRFASHHRTGSMPLHLLPTSPSYKILLSPSTHFSYLYDSPLIIVQGACPYIYYPLLPAIRFASHHRTGSMPLHLLPTSPSYKILLSPSTHFSYLYDSPLIIVQGACPYIYYPLLPAIRFASHHRTGSMPLHLLPTSPSYKILLSPSTHFSYLYDLPLIIVQGACPYIYYPLLPAIRFSSHHPPTSPIYTIRLSSSYREHALTFITHFSQL